MLLESDEPAYVETRKGLFSGQRHVMPVEGMSASDDDLTVAYTKDQIEGAPPVNQDDEIDYERERELGAHYGAQVRDWDDARDSWRGEDLSRGPTPETRHPGGGLDDARDTTETDARDASTMRAPRTTDGHPASPRPTAAPGDVGGTQTRRARVDGRRRRRRRGHGPLRGGAARGHPPSEAGRLRLRKWIETEPVRRPSPRGATARVERSR